MISSAPTVDIAHSPYEFNLSDESPKKNIHKLVECTYVHTYVWRWMDVKMHKSTDQNIKHLR